MKKVAKLEFNRSRKSMGVICSTTNGANTLYVKGAPENVLERCSHVLLESGRRVKLTAAMRRNINAEVESMSLQALRCLALAMNDDLSALPGKFAGLAEYDGSEDHVAHSVFREDGADVTIESGMTFVGVAAMRDPPRSAGATHSRVQDGRRGVIVITGDNQRTASHLQKIGLLKIVMDCLLSGETLITAVPKVRLLESAKAGRAWCSTGPSQPSSNQSSRFSRLISMKSSR